MHCPGWIWSLWNQRHSSPAVTDNSCIAAEKYRKLLAEQISSRIIFCNSWQKLRNQYSPQSAKEKKFQGGKKDWKPDKVYPSHQSEPAQKLAEADMLVGELLHFVLSNTLESGL